MKLAMKEAKAKLQNQIKQQNELSANNPNVQITQVSSYVQSVPKPDKFQSSLSSSSIMRTSILKSTKEEEIRTQVELVKIQLQKEKQIEIEKLKQQFEQQSLLQQEEFNEGLTFHKEIIESKDLQIKNLKETIVLLNSQVDEVSEELNNMKITLREREEQLEKLGHSLENHIEEINELRKELDTTRLIKNASHSWEIVHKHLADEVQRSILSEIHQDLVNYKDTFPDILDNEKLLITKLMGEVDSFIDLIDNPTV